MRGRIIPYPDKPIKHNEIVSYCEPVATKVGCTWKKYIRVPYIPCQLGQMMPCLSETSFKTN